MELTQEQLEQFDREGYLFLPNLFSPEEAAFLKSEAETIYGMDRKEVWREKSGVARTAFAAHQLRDSVDWVPTPVLSNQWSNYRLKVYMHQYKVNAKAPFDGAVWQWHQDYGTEARR